MKIYTAEFAEATEEFAEAARKYLQLIGHGIGSSDMSVSYAPSSYSEGYVTVNKRSESTIRVKVRRSIMQEEKLPASVSQP